jgi:hypothetical protein
LRYGLRGAALLLLAGCTQFPELERSQTPGVARAPYPALLPLDALLNGPQPTVDAAMIDSVEARAEGLRRRSAGLEAAPAGGDAALTARLARLRARAEALREAEP